MQYESCFCAAHIGAHRKLPHHQKPSELNVLSRMVEYIFVTMLQLRHVWRISQQFRESLGDCQQKHIKILRGYMHCVRKCATLVGSGETVETMPQRVSVSSASQ